MLETMNKTEKQGKKSPAVVELTFQWGLVTDDRQVQRLSQLLASHLTVFLPSVCGVR